MFSLLMFENSFLKQTNFGYKWKVSNYRLHVSAYKKLWKKSLPKNDISSYNSICEFSSPKWLYNKKESSI